MEDMIKALLDVVRAQHSAAEGTEETPFGIDDIVDMAMNIMGRPDEKDELDSMVESIQAMVGQLAPDIFPPKTFEQMDEEEKAASAANMIEESLLRGRTGRRPAVQEPQEEASEEEPPSHSYNTEHNQPGEFDAQETADLNDLIYNNLMQMMGLQNPQVEYPFDRSQLRYGREKTMTEMLEEERQADKAAEGRREPERRQLSAWELAQHAIDEDEAAHEKEPYIPQVAEEPVTKSASQLAAEAIRRSQEEDREKLEIEKQAERLMEEARKRGQDPMKFALHQQEILQYMEKNSDELVSFEDYEDLSPEEKLEIERQIYVEKQIADGIAPDQVDTQVPEEYVPQELRTAPDTAQAAEETADGGGVQEASAGAGGAKPPAMTEEMLRQLSQEVIRENSDMILSDNADADMDSINEMIFQNIKNMMEGSGTPVVQEDVESLLEQAAAAAKEEKRPPAEENPEQNAVLHQETEKEAGGISAVELARAAQRAARPEPKEVKEEKSAVELAKEAQEEAMKARQQESSAGMEQTEAAMEIPEVSAGEPLDGTDVDDMDLEALFDEEFAKDNDEASPDMPEPVEKEPEDREEDTEHSQEALEALEAEDAGESLPEEKNEEEPSLEEELPEGGEEKLAEEEEEFEYVEPGELVLGEHTQAELDEALENLDSIGLEGDVYERAKRMLLLELAGSEAELEAWLREQEQGRKKRAAVSALDGEDILEMDDLDEDTLEKELELAMDEDFVDDGSHEGETAFPEPEQIKEELSQTNEEKPDVEPENAEKEIKENAEEPDNKEREEEKERNAPAQDAPEETDTEQENAGDGKEEGQDAAHKAKANSCQVSVKRPFVLKNSASFMNQFEDYIADIQENRKLSTGFKKLDAMLRYGLHKGSYFVDARPQYLKNSFMLQMADRAAESGVDVLYISTELSRYDLMVESVSRLSYEISQKDKNKAVSVMSIMTGEDGADLASLKDELNWYRGRISEHLYILDQEAVMDYTESMEDVSAGDILEGLIRSIVKEGAHKPAVFIDNIENILSVEDSEDMEPLMGGIRKLARNLGIPIVLSYGYAQAETESELNPSEQSLHRCLGNMCDVYMELKFAEMITEESGEVPEEEMKEMADEGETLLIDIFLHKNRKALKASCQIQGTPKYNYYEE